LHRGRQRVGRVRRLTALLCFLPKEFWGKEVSNVVPPMPNWTDEQTTAACAAGAYRGGGVVCAVRVGVRGGLPVHVVGCTAGAREL
jgi:hypothetical protein